MSPVDAAPALSPGGRRMKIQTKDPKPRVMSPDQALTAAADFLGEAFVFAVAGGLVWWEAGKSQARSDSSHWSPYTTPFASWTPFLKDFARRSSPSLSSNETSTSSNN